LSKHKPIMLSKKFLHPEGGSITAILSALNVIVFNLLKYMYNLSLLNPFVLDHIIALCCIN